MRLEGMKKSIVVQDGSKVYASMGNKPCNLGCIYCFVNAEGYPGAGRVDTQEGLQQLIFEIEKEENIKIILPSHDVELFLVKNWSEELMKLAEFGLFIVISTKLSLDRGVPPRNWERIDQLKRIDARLKSNNNALLQIAVSITRLTDWKEIEQFTSSPEERITTVQRLSEAGLAVNIAIRPTLPFVPREEFEELIARTAPYCESYLTSPLYLTPKMKSYMDKRYPGYEVELFRPAFMQGGTEIETVNTRKTMDMVKEIAAKYNRSCFTRSGPAIEHAISLRS